MAAMNAETLYKDFVRCLALDIFPSPSTAGFFGMGDINLAQPQDVLGVWIGLHRYGLLDKEAFKQAIREDRIGIFFEEGRFKLAARGHGYAQKVREMSVFFVELPPLGAEPPRDLVSDTKQAYLTAIDTYTMPHFQTPETQLAAWVKAENLLAELMQQPQLPGTLEVLEEALEFYEEAREIYNMRRRKPAGLKALISRPRAENRRSSANV
jgi:hypothetical protein